MIDDLVQFNSVAPVLFVMPALGAVVFEVIIALAVAVQPLAPVTVTMKVPAEVIVWLAFAPNPLFHE